MPGGRKIMSEQNDIVTEMVENDLNELNYSFAEYMAYVSHKFAVGI